MFEINSIDELENLSEKITWQHFEKLVAFVFEKNEFDVKHCLILSDEHKNRHQFDVVAKKAHITYIAECKRWKSRAGAVSEIKHAVEKLIEDCKFYSKLNQKEHVIPIIVTTLNGMPEQHKNVFIVPLNSLNWFLNSYEYQSEDI